MGVVGLDERAWKENEGWNLGNELWYEVRSMYVFMYNFISYNSGSLKQAYRTEIYNSSTSASLGLLEMYRRMERVSSSE